MRAGDDARRGWLAGGSYLVARRIRMTIETWDRQPLREQEDIVGRTKDEGAPLSGGTEFTEPDFAHARAATARSCPVDAHVRLAHPDPTAAPGCCAAATTSSTAPTASAA